MQRGILTRFGTGSRRIWRPRSRHHRLPAVSTGTAGFPASISTFPPGAVPYTHQVLTQCSCRHSSLAFDTIYAEGQRRYVESLSAYARQFLSMMEKPDVDHIEGLSPAISIEQKTTSTTRARPSAPSPRSTTTCACCMPAPARRAARPRRTPRGQTVSQMVDQVLACRRAARLMLLAPVISERKGEYQKLLAELHAQGFIRARIDGETSTNSTSRRPRLHKKHTIEVVVDRFVRATCELRLAESFETALHLAEGVAASPGWTGRRTNRSPTSPSRPISPARCAATASRNWSRGCSRSTTRSAPARRATASASSSSSTRRQGRRQPRPVAGGGAVRGLGPAQRLLLPDDPLAGAHLRLRSETPWHELPQEIRQVILWAAGSRRSKFSYFNERGRVVKKSTRSRASSQHAAALPRDRVDNAVREELAKFTSRRSPARLPRHALNEGARNVFVDDTTCRAITSDGGGTQPGVLRRPRPARQAGQDRPKILKEINDRLRFLVNVGLNYLTLDRRPRPCPAARRSASAWPARSAPAWSA